MLKFNFAVPLFFKQTVDGKNFLIVWSKEGKLESYLIEDNRPSKKYPIKGISDIKIDNEQQLVEFSQFLAFNSYTKTSDNSLIFNARGCGGGSFLGFLLGAAQVTAGVILIVGSGGIGTIFGTALIGSGVQGAIYSIKTEDDDLSAIDFVKASAIGMAAGAIGGAGTAITVAAETGFLTTMAIQAVSGVASNTTTKVTHALLNNKNVNQALQESLTPSSLLSGAAVQMIAVGGNSLGGQVAEKILDNVTNKIGKVIIDGACEVTTRIITESVVTATGNFIEGRDITENLDEAIIKGAMIGLTVAAIKPFVPCKDPQNNNNSNSDKNVNPDKELNKNCFFATDADKALDAVRVPENPQLRSPVLAKMMS